MPSAPQIRKQMLGALDEFIIPALRSQIVPQVLAGPPFDFSSVPHWTIREKPLPDRKANPLNVVLRWQKENLLARRMSQIAFVYTGSSDERVGITRQMAKKLKNTGQPVPAGVTAFHLTAPAAFYVPANIPHSGPAQQEALPASAPLRMLVLQFTEHELLLRLFEADKGGTHHLNIVDPSFIQMEHSYVQMLAQSDYESSHRQLLALMSRLGDYLKSHRVAVSNSAWPVFKEQIFTNPSASPRSTLLCYKAIDYIQFHLHTPLRGSDLAQVCGVSYMHLNRVLREVTGLTVMRFVTKIRIEAAKLMLADNNERIGDIARLVGFSSAQSFSVVFARHVGLHPREYRRLHAVSKRSADS